MFFRRKTKENHAKSVQNVRKLVFSLGKTTEKQNKKRQQKKKDPKKRSTPSKGEAALEHGKQESKAFRGRWPDGWKTEKGAAFCLGHLEFVEAPCMILTLLRRLGSTPCFFVSAWFGSADGCPCRRETEKEE